VRGTLDLSRFVSMAQTHRAEDPGAQRVRVMTIHASKGLEFDAVVLPDLDGRWMLRNDDLLTDRPGPLDATTAISHSAPEMIREYDPVLAGLHEATMGRTVHAELCCVYVALTRAKMVLEMIVAPKSGAEAAGDEDAGGAAGTSGGGPAKLSLSAAGVVAGALAPGSALRAGELVFSSGREPREAVREATGVGAVGADGAGVRPVERAGTTPPTARRDGEREVGVEGVAGAAEVGVSARHLPRASPSGMEGGDVVDVSLLLRPVSSAGRDKGTAMHAFFECVAWLEDGEPDEATLLRAATRAGADERLSRGLIGEFRVALGSAIGAALRRERYGAGGRLELLREQRFSVVDRRPETGQAALLNGAIDRLVVRVDAQGRAVEAEVLDYKTDAIGADDGERLRQRVEHYTPQVRAYKRAAAGLLGLDVSKVRGVLLFTGVGRLLAIEGA
jgi:ATP-dependent exoDNAse (exonuclease V) beta subunit